VRILDTDHCVAILRGNLDVSPIVSPEEELAITTINLAELTYGAYKSARPEDNLARLDVLLSATTILPFDEASARRYGRMRARLEKEGQKLSDLDLQIASIALECDSTVVSHNQAHFERLVEMEGLKLEDWIAED
jgi:tRNA(fMet)-specific endonuclease VapC